VNAAGLRVVGLLVLAAKLTGVSVNAAGDSVVFLDVM
jgi:hypothetical protein